MPCTSWQSEPTLNQIRSFPGGTSVGGTTLVAAGGFTGCGDDRLGGDAGSRRRATTASTTSAATTTPTTATSTTATTATRRRLDTGRRLSAHERPLRLRRPGRAAVRARRRLGRNTDPRRQPLRRNNQRLDALAPIPVASEAPCGAHWNGKIYVAEGDTGSSFRIYDIASNSWTTGAARPVASGYGCAAGALNNKVYVIGGAAARRRS